MLAPWPAVCTRGATAAFRALPTRRSWSAPPRAVPDLFGATALSASGSFGSGAVMVMLQDGTVWGWGSKRQRSARSRRPQLVTYACAGDRSADPIATDAATLPPGAVHGAAWSYHAVPLVSNNSRRRMTKGLSARLSPCNRRLHVPATYPFTYSEISLQLAASPLSAEESNSMSRPPSLAAAVAAANVLGLAVEPYQARQRQDGP
jgi:hypothetical protein